MTPENDQELDDNKESVVVDTAEEEKENRAVDEEDSEQQDDEQVDEDAEENDEDAEEGTTQADEAPRKNRAQDRIRRINEERAKERQEKEQLIAEKTALATQLEHFRQQQQQVQTEQQRRAEEERLALLSPEDRNSYELNRKNQLLEQRLNQLEFQHRDAVDRANFYAKAQHDDVYAKYLPSVEQMYQEGLQRGVQASREDLLAYAVGKELIKDKTAKASDKKAKANKRIDSVTSKPASAKGDVTGAKKGRTEEDRLRGVLI